MDFILLGLSKKYTEDTAIGLGAVKGAPATIEKIISVDGGSNITFKWTGTDGTQQTQDLFVPNGKSAYEYAKSAGYRGTEKEFAEKLASSNSSSGEIPSDIYTELDKINTTLDILQGNLIPTDYKDPSAWGEESCMSWDADEGEEKTYWAFEIFGATKYEYCTFSGHIENGVTIHIAMWTDISGEWGIHDSVAGEFSVQVYTGFDKENGMQEKYLKVFIDQSVNLETALDSIKSMRLIPVKEENNNESSHSGNVVRVEIIEDWYDEEVGVTIRTANYTYDEIYNLVMEGAIVYFDYFGSRLYALTELDMNDSVAYFGNTIRVDNSGNVMEGY